jgi:hypothetical protein
VEDAEWAARARHLADQGESADAVARSLLAAGAGPWATIKSLRGILDIGLKEAKSIVDRNLPPEVRALDERLRVDGTPRQFTPPAKVRFATRSDGVPVVFAEVEASLARVSGLAEIAVKRVDVRRALAGWGIRMNLMLGVLHGSSTGFVIAGPCFPNKREMLEEANRWIDNLEANGGAISVLVDVLPTSDIIDGTRGRGGFFANLPRT